MDDREAARELLRGLGASEEQLAAAEEQRDLQGFVSDIVLARGRTLTVADVAMRADVDPERVTAMWRALGVTVDDPTQPLFSEEDASITEGRLRQLGIERRELARVAVGFVDLVGFTSLSRRLDPAELSSLVTRFEMRAFDVTASLGGRVVRHIGDEVMFVSLDPVAGCRIALALTAAFTDDGIEPRGGLCAGDVLVLHGDYYGPVVNLASRLTDAAVPGEVLVDDSVVASLVDMADVAYEPAGRRQLKGFDDTVRVHALLRS